MFSCYELFGTSPQESALLLPLCPIGALYVSCSPAFETLYDSPVNFKLSQTSPASDHLQSKPPNKPWSKPNNQLNLGECLYTIEIFNLNQVNASTASVALL